MMSLEKKLLNKLIDLYENSSLSRGTNKRNTHIYFYFNKKTLPSYFDENSMEFEQIHAVVRILEEREFIQIIWRGGKEGHIIDKIMLCEEHVLDIYHSLGRIPKLDKEKLVIELCNRCITDYTTPVVSTFADKMLQRLEAGKSVKEYVDIQSIDTVEELFRAIYLVECNERECFVREFSIQNFHDSKKFEVLMPKVCRIIREEREELADMEMSDIMAEYLIYHTPGYVYFKGNVSISYADNTPVYVGAFPQGIGLGLDFDSLASFDISTREGEIREVYTIENLTSFFRFERESSLIIYLGGYHNQIRRKLLQSIYQVFPDIKYYHFGDMDAGGFQILDDLKRKTGIPFEPYQMNVEILRSYEQYGKRLTEHDRTRLLQMLEQCHDSARQETIAYMLEHNVKLEQECIV